MLDVDTVAFKVVLGVWVHDGCGPRYDTFSGVIIEAYWAYYPHHNISKCLPDVLEAYHAM